MSNSLFALSPLDGRYRGKMGKLPLYFSEAALMEYRLMVEVEYLIALGEEKGIVEVKPFTDRQKEEFRSIYNDFGVKDAEEVKLVEAKTNHDVKAIEYFLRDRVSKIKGIEKPVLEFVHFCCTSEDINNLAYALMVKDALKEEYLPFVGLLIKQVKSLAVKWQKVPMLSMTHGQPATPTTVGKEFWVFHERLARQVDRLKEVSILGKFNGASGNWNAYLVCYPQVNWVKFSEKFIRSLKLKVNYVTTQVESHDWNAELFDAMRRVNVILLDLDRDMWLYISRGVFGQKLKEGEVGSSTMPHKVNPIDFENSEGNIKIANGFFDVLSRELPVSRMQRDLTDSTLQRNIGVAFGHTVLALQSALKGLGKLELNRKVLSGELDDHWELLAEPIQQVMRKNGITNAYEKLKEMTRGEKVTREGVMKFVEGLKISDEDKQRLKKLTPGKYVAFAGEMVG